MGLFKRLFSDDSDYKQIDINNDSEYYKFFLRIIGPQIYQQHSQKYFVCCAFCSYLQRSNCHETCYTCSKETYRECSPILPESLGFAGNQYNRVDNGDFVPWIFKTPCTSFEKLSKSKYFRNFIDSDTSITIGNFETLEGIFIGLCRGKKPCHICASINVNIFNNCSQNERYEENKACQKILDEISTKYKHIMGMIKYLDY